MFLLRFFGIRRLLALFVLRKVWQTFRARRGQTPGRGSGGHGPAR
jgi:hypothetical protein